MGLDVLDVLNHGLGSRDISSIALDDMQCIAKFVDVLDRDPSFLPCRFFAIFAFFLGMRVLLDSTANRTNWRGHLSSSGYCSSGGNEIASPSPDGPGKVPYLASEHAFYGGPVFFLDVRHHYILACRTYFSSSTAAFGFEL